MTTRQTANAQSLLRLAATASLVTTLLAGCAGNNDFLELAEPTGHHPFPVRSATLGRNKHEVHGIDIAKYQGNIDWQRVKQSGIAFAFIKATEGSDRLDKKFHQNWAAAKAAGIPRGAYHFNYWCSPMEKQFAWFKRNVPVEKDAMPPVLDLEWNTHSPTCPRKVPRAVAQREIRKFVRMAEAHYGKRPILYTDIRFYRDVLSDGSFSRYPLWVRATRKLPQQLYPGRRWAFWQYSDRSRIPGIKGRVDKNAFSGSRRAWRQLVAANFAMKPTAAERKIETLPKQPGEGESKPPTPATTAIAAKAGTKTIAVAGRSQSGNTAAKTDPGKKTQSNANQKNAPAVRATLVVRTKPKAGKPLSLAPLNLGKKKTKQAAR